MDIKPEPTHTPTPKIRIDPNMKPGEWRYGEDKCPTPTPTPWHRSDILDDNRYGIVDSENNIVVGISGRIRRKEDVDFIVCAVNSHEALLDAAKRARLAMLSPNDMERWEEAKEDLKEAIAKAEGQP